MARKGYNPVAHLMVDNTHKNSKKKKSQKFESVDYSLIAKNPRQSKLIAEINNNRNHIIFATGPAGTGKTYVSVKVAIQQLLDDKIQKIVISRPNVSAGGKMSDIGHLPGDIEEKLLPYLMPVVEVFYESLGKSRTECMLKNGTIEIVPIAFIRGRTFKNSIVIIDEAQNLTMEMLKAGLTRIGDHSKIIVCGDTRQNDLGKDSGLQELCNRIDNSNQHGIRVIEFNNSDIERHPVIEHVLDLFED